ncbi:TPA: hypothetical protein MNC23_002353 [Citrobacter freundii]|mgnify:CR=1 FL=1|uniref:Uncharacterized protein n=1 Tax=Enterobacter roggenkampii TaxID=1812935 RepID=A0ABD7KCR9_9ENTR|nr:MULTISPECIES: hypothetical protein [Enterobacteriaceae]HBK3103603.1 hypothetical protein [Escherichia coli]ASG44430.1 hypothetical protein CES93_12685 [Citrobacter freundii]AYL54852.1 hypothetical protein CUC47_26775 [Citrobacter freundii]EIQ8246077.1 hypothetical protein [Citrobacter freundii]EJD6638258.1 hypothetical protein [Citrobacter freundii]
MKIRMLMILLVLSSSAFAAQKENEDIKNARLLMAKTKYLVSRFDDAIILNGQGNPSSLLALNKDMGDLYKDGIRKYGMSAENGFKVSPFSDCSTMSTAAYNLWQEKKSTLTDSAKNVEHVNSTYINAYSDCKRAIQSFLMHENANATDEKITIIDVP